MTEKPKLRVVQTEAAPAPVQGAPYSQAVIGGDVVYVAGQLGLDPASGTLVAEDVTAQTHQAMENLRAILEEAGSAMADVLKVTVFLDDLDDFAAMNEAYREHLDAPFPARTTVEVSALPLGARVELDVLARA